MNLEWVERKEKEQNEKIAQFRTKIVNSINEADFLDVKCKQRLLGCLEEYEKEPYFTVYKFTLLMHKMLPDADFHQIDDFVHKTLELERYLLQLRYRGYRHVLDSEPVEFNGDIIITDPCYILKSRDESTKPKWEDFMRLPDYKGMNAVQLEAVGYHEDYAKLREAEAKWDEENPDDWDICECGYDFEPLGFKHWMSRGTIYGDWSCTTFNMDTKQAIGKFCADGGKVAVFELKEVLEYNPDYDDHINKPWCVTWIKNFKGTVQFVVDEDGTDGEGFSVHVIGHGIDTETEEPINFITTQTGL